ncbi:MFS transporter [Fulvivirgaceae bacterium BMA12]|uniref:MFS transporter n=1 Tax=Agaribacillus aureus TaxID=3051825 RepID=A0ABT8LCY6_9BACT|nr:MFS transporter [Fulvivirgaceae bacterium BMA12]
MTTTTTTKKTTLWGRDFIIHTLSYLLIFSGFYFLLPTLPFYVVNDLGQDESRVGYIIGIYALSALLIRPVAGYALDAYGRKSVYLWSLLAYVLISGLYIWVDSYVSLLILRILHGLSWGVITNGGITIASDLVPEKRRGEGISYFSLSITLSMALGPLVGLSILEQSNFQMLFIWTFIISLLALAMALMIQYVKIPPAPKKLTWAGVYEKKVVHITLMMLVTAVTYGGLMSFLTLYAEELAISNIPLVFLVFAIGVASLRPFSGQFMDKNGPRVIILWSFTITVFGYILLSQTKTEYLFLLACFITGVGNGLIMPTILTMTANLVGADRRGVANSTIYSATDLGIGLGSILLGYVVKIMGLSNMFLLAGLLLILPLVYFFLVAYRHYNFNRLN